MVALRLKQKHAQAHFDNVQFFTTAFSVKHLQRNVRRSNIVISRPYRSRRNGAAHVYRFNLAFGSSAAQKQYANQQR
jgi:hypothetical protein